MCSSTGPVESDHNDAGEHDNYQRDAETLRLLCAILLTALLSLVGQLIEA
jgi:hypothetical protein